MVTLNTLIDKAEDYPLGENDIMTICQGRTKIVSYTDLPNCTNIFDLLKPYDNFILFYETTSLRTGHWVCVVYHPKQNMIELFDSYGKNDEQLLGYADTAEKYMNRVPYLSYLISLTGCRFQHNQIRFQSGSNKVSTCGRYAALRSRFHTLSLVKFQNLFQNNKYPADFMVSAMTVMFSELPSDSA